MTAIEFNTKLTNEKQSLNNFAMSLTHNTDDALDLLQDTKLISKMFHLKYNLLTKYV